MKVRYITGAKKEALELSDEAGLKKAASRLGHLAIHRQDSFLTKIM